MYYLQFITKERVLSAVRLPVYALLVVISLRVVWLLLGMPEQSGEIAMLTKYIQQYGLPLILVGSFFEALLVIGWYFPGSFLIFISVITAPTTLVAVISVCVVAVGLYIGYICSFLLGKYGWYTIFLKLGLRQQLDDAKKNLEQRGERALFLSFWNPGLGSFTATAAGILQMPTIRFLSIGLMATVAWCSFWGVVVSLLGERAIPLMFSWTFVLSALTLWFLVRLFDEIQDAKKAVQQRDQQQLQ